MKKIITLAFSILFAMTAFGQRLEYEKSSKWFFGLNAGATWNTTDVQNKTYAGWGFLFGKSFNYDYGRRLSYDLRLRYLRGKWYGQDTDSTNLDHLGATYNGALSPYKDGLGYTVNNFEADVHELGLELAIHFNRFRDRTGWDPYIFGGANIVWNETYGDLLNQDVFLFSDSLTYAYDQIDMNKPAIEFALDDNYETALDGTTAGSYNVNFMPSLGIGLGYDFGPRFSMGIEHKTTFALKDDFDGYVDAEPNWGFLENDIYHYTNAYLTWRFRGRGEGRVRPTPINQPDPTIGGISSSSPCQDPQVRVTRPLHRTETVQSGYYVYRAEVKFVESRNQIVMRVNGIETTNFLYNHDTHQLESYMNLQPGNNVIEITGRNTCGTDTESSTIIFDNCVDPIVYFQNVCGNTFTAEVEQRAYTVQAQISNATSIEFTVNGVRTTNYTYNSATGQFTSNIFLNEGQNTIRITAISACGTDTGTSVVTYTNCADPFISFVDGNNGFVSVSDPNFNLSAYVYNAENKNNIKFRVNGSNRYFNFSTSTNLLTSNLTLNPGQNTIQITVTNNCGTDTETLTIDYTPCVDPSIQMVLPLAQSTTTTNGTQVIKATLLNVANINQVQLFVNGNLQPGGIYNPITKLFEASVALNSGFNTIQITVLNDCGSDNEVISVNYDPCNTPDVQMILPATSGGLVSSPSQLVQAMAFNVNNINEIQTYVNGALQSGGTFNSTNGLYQITVGLTLGVNTIQVVATNDCGSDVQTVTITYRACEAPQITMINPTAEPFFTTATNINVSAMIGAITNPSQVQLTVNGVVDASGATYNGASITYSNNVNLSVGNNNIVITATNNCGSVTKVINVVRELVVVDIPVDNIDSIVICYVHSNNVGDPVTMTIPLSQWPTYQSQGAQLGPCPVIDEPVDEPMTICYKGGNNPPMTIQILTSEWPAYQALGATQGPCPVQTMEICFNGNELTIPVTQWDVYQAEGATEGPCPVEPDENIVICLNGTEMTILTSQWANYQSQGAVLGPCPIVDPEMVICLKGTEMTILTSQWPTYQAQGATQGPCPVDPEIVICLDGREMTILTSQWPTYQAQGATEGPCPVDPEIVICLDGTEMSILTSQWPTYQAQGATQGPCPVDPEMTICFVVNGVRTTMNILTSQWPSYQAQGAMEGPCPSVVDPLITICMDVNGVPTTSQILTSQWPAYQAQGAVQGPCPAADPEIVICLKGTEMTILTSQWPTYQAQGATQGPCPTVGGGNGGCMPDVSGTFSSDNLSATANSTKDLSNVVLKFHDGTTQKFDGLSGYSGTFSGTGANEGKCIVGMWIKSGCNNSDDGPGYGEYVANAGYDGACSHTQQLVTICYGGQELQVPPTALGEYLQQGAVEGPCQQVVDSIITICLDVHGVPTTKQILASEWPAYATKGATKGACVEDPKITICINGLTKTILTSQWSRFESKGATLGPCPTIDIEMIVICLDGEEREIPETEWSKYASKGAVQGPCPELMQICLDGVEMEIPRTEWVEYKNQGAVKGPCVSQHMTICYNGRTLEIQVSEWATYQERGATIGACTDDGAIQVGNADTLNGNIGRPTNGGGDEDELLFGNRTITICHTPNGSIASQTMQIPLSQWEEYQRLGATLGACTGSLDPNGGGNIQINNDGTTNADGVGGVPINPNGSGGTPPTGGNMQQLGNGSQEATQDKLKTEQEEAERKAAEAAAEKARQEQAAKEAALKAKEEALRKAEAERKAAEAAAAEKARQEQAAKEAAQKAAQEEANRKAEEAKRKAAEVAAEKARQEQAAKEAAQKAAQEEANRKAEEAKRKAAEVAAEKARREQAAKEAAQKAAQEEARRKAEEAKRKAAQEAAEKARREQAAKEAAQKAAQEEARRKAEEAKRKAAQEAAEKARREQAAKEAAQKAAQEEARRKAEEAKRKAAQEAAEKARREQAAREAAAKKAAQEEARRKAEEAKRKAAQEAAEKARREKAAKEAAAKKAAEEAARKKAEEQRKLQEKEGGR